MFDHPLISFDVFFDEIFNRKSRQGVSFDRKFKRESCKYFPLDFIKKKKLESFDSILRRILPFKGGKSNIFCLGSYQRRFDARGLTNHGIMAVSKGKEDVIGKRESSYSRRGI